MRLAREFERVGGRDLRRFIDYVDEQELDLRPRGRGAARDRVARRRAADDDPRGEGARVPGGRGRRHGPRRPAADDIPLRVSADGRVGLQLSSLAGKGPAALDLDVLKREEEERGEARSGASSTSR